MKARQLMTSDPFVITPAESIGRAAELLRDLEIGLLPVVDGVGTMRVKGVITDRDIVIRCVAREHAGRCTVADHMTAPPLATIDPDAEIRDVLALMEARQLRRILVVDSDGRLVGVIAQADVATKLGRTEPLEVEKLVEAISAPAPVTA